MGPLDILRILPYNGNSSNKSLFQVQYPLGNELFLGYPNTQGVPN